VSLIHVPDAETCITALAKGVVDVCNIDRAAGAAYLSEVDGRPQWKPAWRTQLADAQPVTLQAGRNYRLFYLMVTSGALQRRELRQALSAAVDREGFCGGGNSEMRAMSTILPPFLTPTEASFDRGGSGAADDLDALRALTAERPLRIGHVRGQSRPQSLCASLEQVGVRCEPTLVGLAHIEEHSTVVDASIIHIRDTLTDPFLRLTTILGLASKGGLTVEAVAPYVEAVDNAVSERERQTAIARFTEAMHASLPLVPLCYTPPAKNTGVIFIRRGLEGVIETPNDLVKVSEPFDGVPAIAERAWWASPR
jgi:hypothetical protein